MPDDFELEPFIQSLIETVVWCRHQLNGSDNHEVLWSLGDGNVHLFDMSDEEIKEYCGHVIADRANKVHHLEVPTYEHLLPVIQQGRLMLFYYQCTTSDGYPQTESDNYFDFQNYPPYDTWIYHVDADPDSRLSSYLLAWVPQQFVDQVDGAIQGCADESILWLTDEELNIPYKKTLEAADLWI